MGAAEAGFAYRHSNRGGSIVLEVVLSLELGDAAAALARYREILDAKLESQPSPAMRSSGCVFKNPPQRFAGLLLDEAGLKGRRVGNAQISPVHANFFVNLGEAQAADVRALIEEAREAVLAQFGVRLELEIQLVGEWG